ncbi:MAG: Holliday junction resolvase RuvX [Pseudomarimonas sp.]
MSTASSGDSPVCALGFDVGARRTGVAVGNSLTMSARALLVIEHVNESVDWSRLDVLRNEWRPQVLIVGEPLTLEGEAQPATFRARKFANQLQQRFDLPVVMVDERSTSKEADLRFAAARAKGNARRRDGALQDAIAAQIILERWLLAGMPLESSS